ncbi:MAG: transposase [Planctomycetota bacterium]
MTKREPSIRKVRDYAMKSLGLERYLRRPGDGRKRPQIQAADLLWAQLSGQILQKTSFHDVERLVHSGVVRELTLHRVFSEDSLAYFNDRLDPQPTRAALVATAKRAKRNKAFRGQTRIGLAIDGTGAGRCRAKSKVCKYCRPFQDDKGNVIGHKHELVMASVVGVGLSLPIDVEPYEQGDCELAGGQRLLARITEALGPRFANYVVADAKFAAAPFLNEAVRLGLHAVVRLKDNVPSLFDRVTARFNSRAPDAVIDHRGEPVEIWDDETFEPWEGLEWRFVRVIRYRYRSAKGEVVDAYWLTDYSQECVSSMALFRLAKSRWEIENEGFNEAKTRHGMEHICHHDANALLVGWLLLLLGLVIERLYRHCFLHRGSHPRITAADLLLLLLLALARPPTRAGPERTTAVSA